MQRFRDFARADWTDERDQAADAPGAAAPDRDLKDVVPELNAARRDVKAAIKKARRSSEDQQRHAAALLQRAAAEIEALGEDDIDI